MRGTEKGGRGRRRGDGVVREGVRRSSERGGIG
jgi:hypothetical protein